MKNIFTHTRVRPALLAAVLGLALYGNAGAATYTTLDSAASKVSFGYSQMSVDMTGGFSEVKATELQFDPATPDTARIALEIALKGVDAGYAEANTELAKDEWLNTAKFPLASFTARKVTALGDNRFEAAGDLVIKGNTRPITVPFTVTETADNGVFKGQFTLQRSDFNIGEGQWKDFSIVADNITITFSLVAKP
ncbi:MAG: YceI family protein [Alcaligenaceae bacterium]|jgi:polyisoprenoid-binding protein YceI|nr:YceI family protein [Alcaligenaceae bacterium]